MGDERDPAAPQLPVPAQFTLPHHPYAPPPWLQAPAPLPPKPSALEPWKFVLQVFTVVATLGGGVFAVGRFAGEFTAFKKQVTDTLAAHGQKIGVAADDASKANSTATDLALQVRELNAKLGALNVTGRNRSRRIKPSEDAPLPPTP
jgi:hypothetical protein